MGAPRFELCVLYLLATRNRWGWWQDLASVVPWLLYYTGRADYQLFLVPLLFAVLDLKALGWWR